MIYRPYKIPTIELLTAYQQNIIVIFFILLYCIQTHCKEAHSKSYPETIFVSHSYIKEDRYFIV